MTSSETTLSTLLDRVRVELDTMGQIVSDMQIGLTPLLIGISDHDADAYRHAQNIDLVTQTLQSLSTVIQALARDDSATRILIDLNSVAEALPLAALGARLLGHAATPANDVAGDDLDLF